MAEDEKTKKNNDLKVKKRDYTGYDDDEFVDGNAGMKRSVLAKYDEDIEGTRETVSYTTYPRLCHQLNICNRDSALAVRLLPPKLKVGTSRKRAWYTSTKRSSR